MAPTISTLVPVGFGLFVWSKLLRALVTFSSLVGKMDKKDPVLDVSSGLIGVAPVDAFLKAVIPFFRLTIQDHPSRLLWSMFSPALTPFFFHIAIEGLKPGASLLHVTYPAFAILFQLLGIGFVTPTIWIPLILSHAPSDQLPITPKSNLSLFTVIAAQSIILWPSLNGIDIVKEPAKAKVISFFQIAPAAAWLVWAAAHSLHDDSPIVSSLAPYLPAVAPTFLPTMYHLIAGASVCQHVLTVIEEFSTGASWSMLQLFSTSATKHSAAKTAGHFLAWDWLGSVLGIAWYIACAGKGGTPDWNTLWRVLSVGSIAGPGAAFAMEFARLESR
ncbi:hypothetical protein M427DRAFT_42908 [Gonapodya prolifera JEL478]|uniref:Uncharacterized protein n=1 Tax=Gonapodya prolifera (strain JEL478) TaxID=1344416 RepID=A0A139AL07_GONPJ|nr:hypothetical protein M427DRAFT_42908 [Gonapodya prolifera JEL478]|eukprot:KXS17482.1 hypothetical protein M427DRAFT_42908 [Gonapodya prolifera JEL478]